MRLKKEVVLWTGASALSLFSPLTVCISVYCMSLHFSSIKTPTMFVGVQLWVALCDPSLKQDSINVGRSASMLWLCISAHLSSAYPTTEEGCQLLSAGTLSYIHVTCQYVIEDKVLQLGFSTPKYLHAVLCVYVCVSRRGTYKMIHSGQIYEQED